MIAALSGTVLATASQYLVLDVSGVGYQVYATPETLRRNPRGAILSLFTTLIVREDSLTLFGFETQEEQEVFELLRSANGVGPKLAMAILASLNLEAIRNAVLMEDDSVFKSVSGIGPKTAKLLVVTLAGKLSGAVSGITGTAKVSGAPLADIGAVVEALQGLGWTERQAAESVKDAAAALGAQATRDSLLRTALSRLGQAKTVSGSDS
ncbi:MAG: Holliday junction branch migration protein RuvA [Micrococcales bacterium]